MPGMKPKRDEFSVSLSWRLYGDEARRWIEILKRARNRHVEADKTDVIRALLGLPVEYKNLVTKKDRLFFQSGALGGHAEGIDVDEDAVA
jgi:hypothetical protein